MPTREEIEAAATPAGGWTRKQLAKWGGPWPPPKGWKKRLESAVPEQAFNPLEWCRALVHGVGGFEDFERYEAAVFEDRDVSLAYFVVRALANPRCEDSERMLEAIRQRRAEFLAKAEPALKAKDFEP